MQRNLVDAYRALQNRIATLTGEPIIRPDHMELSPKPRRTAVKAPAARAKRARTSSARRAK